MLRAEPDAVTDEGGDEEMVEGFVIRALLAIRPLSFLGRRARPAASRDGVRGPTTGPLPLSATAALLDASTGGFLLPPGRSPFSVICSVERPAVENPVRKPRNAPLVRCGKGRNPGGHERRWHGSSLAWGCSLHCKLRPSNHVRLDDPSQSHGRSCASRRFLLEQPLRGCDSG